ncbi:MAG: flagellar hook-basal body complex protein [Campylobacterota bacterium]|nr:flagellar hook-basal body complex protein [Campylobacterota bacterium]
MLKSLFSGVSGLQSHQVAMDVESNNIANVNTTGFKYSRANFSDLLAQTSSIATAPQGALGGKNPVQVGLGSTVSSMTRIFSQGSIQNSDKNTDVAIQGDGFFIISPDGGNTYKYTRAGDFKFDAGGNFVDNNGFIAQGWLRDEETGKVDSTAPIKDINIPPGLTTPANATQEVVLKANLNSGPLVSSFSPSYELNSAGQAVDGDGNVLVSQPASDNIGAMFNGSGEAFSMKNGQGITIDYGDGTVHNYIYNDGGALGADEFYSMNDLRTLIEADVQAVSAGVEVTVTSAGKFSIDNTAGGTTLDITVTAITVGTTENVGFTTNMKSLESTLPAGVAGSVSFSQDFNAATHSSSIDIFDSLGTKHTLRTEFRKVSENRWNMLITVPDPATISTTAPLNQVDTGFITFTDEGALEQYTPGNLSFSGNNGSKPNQNVNLSFGTPNQFDGMTSFDSLSSTSGISQDGYTGGDLVGIRIDQSGTLIGSFSNGRSFGLAQIGMAKFTNNEGLSTEGGNVYIQTSNSGDPIIGTAATAGRGFIQSSALEASNVDLSRALTQLIIIQRGFQANGKTITTSDQLLETLIGLKR